MYVGRSINPAGRLRKMQKIKQCQLTQVIVKSFAVFGDAQELERRLIRELRPPWNRWVASGRGTLDHQPTTKTRRRLSASRIGNQFAAGKRWKLSDATKEKMSASKTGANHPNFGKRGFSFKETSILETDLEKSCLKWVWENYSIKSRKVNGLGFRGWPDRLFPLPNERVLWCEFKRPGHKKELTAGQKLIHRLLRKWQQRVEVADNFEAFKQIFINAYKGK